MSVMKSCLSVLILILSPMAGGSVVKKKFTHIEYHHHTWNEALDYCQRHFSDLAVVQSDSDKGLITIQKYLSWIGLTRVGVAVTEQWMWSSGEKLAYEQWSSGEPGATDTCASVKYSSRKLYGFPCEQFYFFYCKVDNTVVFVPESRTWNGARESCHQQGGKLLTLEQDTDLKYIDDQELSVWVKTVGGNVSEDSCVTLQSMEKTITVHNCSHHFPFVCMEDNVFMMEEKKSWEKAVEHCRALVLDPSHHGNQSKYELLSVQDRQDEDFIRTKVLQAHTEQVWVGLRFLGGTWFWIDGVPMTYPGLPTCPPPGKHCGVVSKMAAGVETADCGEKKNFLCYRL
ncbi:secretory phospholipase A2 receptor-like [Gouania willdenowi]|uniref:Secretory phospholipase A2 receptor-like n=1 Tax=Gouania willdenowi TaxID=441366 RepID=A0A8C5ET53_GOUWI|nr:secretory phospholipase A2 receptor-like [Gouania willdenowi]